MPNAPQQLQARMAADAPYALIDVREIGEYNASHMPGSSLIPRARLEFACFCPHTETPRSSATRTTPPTSSTSSPCSKRTSAASTTST